MSLGSERADIFEKGVTVILDAEFKDQVTETAGTIMLKVITIQEILKKFINIKTEIPDIQIFSRFVHGNICGTDNNYINAEYKKFKAEPFEYLCENPRFLEPLGLYLFLKEKSIYMDFSALNVEDITGEKIIKNCFPEKEENEQPDLISKGACK